MYYCQRNCRLRSAALTGIAGFVGLGLSALCTSGSFAKPQDDPVLYDADCGDEPQDATPSWEIDCGGNNCQDFGTIRGPEGDRVLRVTDDSDKTDDPQSERACYCRDGVFDPEGEGDQEAVFELQLQGILAESTPPHHLDIYFAGGLRDTDKSVVLRIAKKGAVHGVGFVKNTPGGLDWIVGGVHNPPEFDATLRHTYRVEKHIDGEDTTIELYLNNDLVVTLDYDLLLDTTQNRAYIFSSGPGVSSYDLDYFRYRIGTTEFPSNANCAADLDDDGTVGTGDLLILLAAWGKCADCNDCPEDFALNCGADCTVGVADLLILLAAWGTSCP